jgi:hypothetical protein
MVAMNPMASEHEEPSLRGSVKPLRPNLELQGLVENRSSTIIIERLTYIENDPSINVYNVVLESGHTYYANGFGVFDMFPNLSQYPRMFKLLHLLWRNCATQVDAHFDDVITPGSPDRVRLEKLAEFVQESISTFLSKK